MERAQAGDAGKVAGRHLGFQIFLDILHHAAQAVIAKALMLPQRRPEWDVAAGLPQAGSERKSKGVDQQRARGGLRCQFYQYRQADMPDMSSWIPAR